jgi:flagellin-like protein
MKKRRDKRGISPVITTLIIILLALVAIGIVWIVIKNIEVKEQKEFP